MAHKRALIRDAIVDLLAGDVDLSGRVFATRTRPTQENELPAVLVYALSETSESVNLARKLARHLTLQIEVRAAVTEDLDSELDRLALLVEARMETEYRFALEAFVVVSWLVATSVGIDGEADQRQGVLTLEYRVDYHGVAGEGG